MRSKKSKGIAASEGSILLTPNEHRVAEDRRDCYWLYAVVDCSTQKPQLIIEKDPAAKPWHEVKKVAHYTLDVKNIGGTYHVNEAKPQYGKQQ